MKYIIFCFVLCVASFSFGFIGRHLELPPHEFLRSLYRKYAPHPPVRMADFTIDTAEISKGLVELNENLETVRDRLKERVILPEDLVKISTEAIDDRQTEISAKLYGINTRAILSKAPESASCLRVYMQGHGGDPFGFKYHEALRDSSNEAGCDFLSMSMVGIGLNTGAVEFPSGKYPGQKTRLNWREAHRHGNFFLYHDNTMPERDALSLFLSPHYYTIKSVMDNYDEVSLLGLSGGGWYTTWMATLIPQVDYAIVYAGSLPMIYRTTEKFFGDYEEMASPTYSDVDYWQLYFLASQTADAGAKRKLFFVFNDQDPCCFMEPAASHFKSVAKEVYDDNVEVIVDQHTSHEMKVSVVQAIWDSVALAKSSTSPSGEASSGTAPTVN